MRCACFSLCTDAEAHAFVSALPPHAAAGSPWHDYLRAVYGEHPPPDTPLGNFSHFYHAHAGWPTDVAWPMAPCARRGSAQRAGIWGRGVAASPTQCCSRLATSHHAALCLLRAGDPKVPPCDVATCHAYLRPDMPLDREGSIVPARRPAGAIPPRAPRPVHGFDGNAVRHVGGVERSGTLWPANSVCCIFRPRNAWCAAVAGCRAHKPRRELTRLLCAPTHTGSARGRRTARRYSRVRSRPAARSCPQPSSRVTRGSRPRSPRS